MSRSCLRLFSLVSIIFFVAITTITTTNLVAGQQCRADQTGTLKRFKNEFAFSTLCTYDANFFGGVMCDNTTGSVTVLQLPSGCLRGTLRSNSSLFELSHLRYLNLSFNNFASSSFSSAFGQLYNLEVLILSSNGFLGQVPSSIRNLTKLTHLQLSHNKLTGNITPLLQNLPNLLALDLSYNQFSGTITPLLQNLTNLSGLDLSYNQFSGTIPSSLFTTPFLSYLDLSENHLTGSFKILTNSSSKLKILSLRNNHFEAEIIDHVLKLDSLQYLSLSSLNLSDPIELNFPKNLTILFLSGCNISEFPRFLKSVKMLELLDLSNNRIIGNVPDWLWSLPRLTSLSLVSNSFTGFEGSLDHVLVNSPVQVLDLALNSFKGPLPNPPFSVINLSVWNNSFTGDIPLSVCNRTSIDVFDLSYNHFTGLIPPCLSNFTIVNLRKNNLEGNIPDEFYNGSWTQTLDVGYNQLTGKLPRSLLNCSALKFISVDHNRINDSFPFWLKALPTLKVLTLRSNRFHGPISPPDDQGPLGFPKLQILEISHNRFTGSLPTNYFANWSVTSHKMNDEERLYMGDYTNVKFTYEDTLDLQYKGLSMEQGKVVTFYAAIDFSGNQLEGEIPESIGLLTTLIALNLSNNSFTGRIPMSFANITELESLDLSRNKLSGNIPKELGSLTFLAYIDVSDNQLTGEIPQGTQIRGQPKSSFEGNPGLCGPPLEESCFSESTPSTQEPEEEEEDEVLNWRAVAIGSGPGVLLGLAIAHVVALYKPEWFIKNIVHNRHKGLRQP